MRKATRSRRHPRRNPSVEDWGGVTPLAAKYWERLGKRDRTEWLLGFFSDRSGGKTFAARHETTRSLQSIINNAGEEFSWRLAKEFADAIDEEATDAAAGKARPVYDAPALDLATVIRKYVSGTPPLNVDELIFLRDAVEKSTVAHGIRVLERIQQDDPAWQRGEDVRFSVASFSSAIFSRGERAGQISFKSSDKCIVRVPNPRRGMTISYGGMTVANVGFSASGERETLLTGGYIVARVDRIPEPGTPKIYGYTTTLYTLREV